MKKILRGRILIHGFSEPFGINFEGLDGLFLCTQHFIQIHLGVVCLYYHNDYNPLKSKNLEEKFIFTYWKNWYNKLLWCEIGVAWVRYMVQQWRGGNT